MYEKRSSVAVWPGPEPRMIALIALAEAAGCAFLGSARSHIPPPADFLLADLTSIPDMDSAYLSKIVNYLESNGAQALIWTDMERLDAHYAKLPLAQCHFLLDGDVDAIPVLMDVLRPDRSNRVHDQNRDAQFGALHKISDELADFARTLARIAEQDQKENSVSDRPISFRPAPAGTFQSFAPTAAESSDISAAALREMIKLRRMRDQFFDSELFADPAWDILLDLLAAQIEGTHVSVSSLCIAASVPPTTALRWIAQMTEHGMLTREHDPDDARRVFIGLSPDTETRLRQYFADMGRKTKPI